MNSATIKGDLKLPASLTTLDMSSATIPGDLKLPASLTTLYMNYATIKGGKLDIPRGCKVYR
jgi:hypothetical protein